MSFHTPEEKAATILIMIIGGKIAKKVDLILQGLTVELTEENKVKVTSSSYINPWYVTETMIGGRVS